MEAVGIAASIISVAGAGWKIAQTLYDIADAVKSGGDRVRGLSSHIHSTVWIIDQVGTALQQDGKLVDQRAVNSAWNYVGRCSEIFDEIEDKISDVRGSDLKTFFFPLQEPALLKLENELQMKMTGLNVLLQCIIAARCRAMDLQSQEILQRMRIQEAIQARNASIKQAAMWEGESVGWAGIYPNTEDTGSAIALPNPVHQHDKNPNPNPTSTEQDSDLHREKPSEQDNPLSETEHQNTDKAPPNNPDFKSVFISALFVVCCPCWAVKHRSSNRAKLSYHSGEKHRPSRAHNISLQGELPQSTEYTAHLSPKPPKTPDSAKHESVEKILPELTIEPRSHKPKPELGARTTERNLISASSRRRARAKMGEGPVWSEPSEQLQTVDDLLRFWTTAYGDGEDESVEESTENAPATSSAIDSSTA